MASRKVVPITAPPTHPFDRTHGTDTGGLIPRESLLTGHPSDAHITAYYAVAPSILTALLDLWLRSKPHAPIGRFSFLDIGAGKGRALLSAATYPFLQAIGIELNPALAHIARINIEVFTTADTSPALTQISLTEADAIDAPLPATPILAFLFHPFEAPVLKALLRKIETAFATRPGTLDILYVNAECADILDRHPAFTNLFKGPVAMSPEDHIADLAAIAQQAEYGSTGDEQCAIYRYTGRSK